MAPTDDRLVQHPHLTTAGLLVESVAGFGARLERQLELHHLSAQWFDVLMRLYRTPGHRLRMSDLAAQTTLTASGLTRAIDRLQTSGLVRREACPSDRRGSFAVLTEAGEARIAAAVPCHVEELAAVFDATYSPEELVTFTELLRRLRDAVNPAAACASALDACDDAEREAEGP